MNHQFRPRRSFVSLGFVVRATVLGVAVSLTACRSAPDPVPWASAFPSGLRQAAVLGIQVVRDGTKISLTNTTSRDIGPGAIWINRRFSLPFDGLGVGESATLHLAEFRDEYSEPFRAGGFFASEAPDKIVQAQIVTKDQSGKSELLGLIVVEGN